MKLHVYRKLSPVIDLLLKSGYDGNTELLAFLSFDLNTTIQQDDEYIIIRLIAHIITNPINREYDDNVITINNVTNDTIYTPYNELVVDTITTISNTCSINVTHTIQNSNFNIIECMAHNIDNHIIQLLSPSYICKLSHIITICDKLDMSCVISYIFKYNIIACQSQSSTISALTNTIIPLRPFWIPFAIINHALHLRITICAYALGYIPVHNNATIYAYDNIRQNTDALLNGMIVNSITCSPLSNTDLERHSNLYPIHTLNAYDNRTLSSCKPIANTLKNLYAHGRICVINDDGLSLCNNIVRLIADQNIYITTCDPFAKTLQILSAQYNSAISDAGLTKCTQITELYANNNPKITTCEPFAQSLTILSAEQQCGISDDGIQYCKSIKILKCNQNHKISKCVHSLQKLHAASFNSSNSNINDQSIMLCNNIVELCAHGNKHITTCAPFAKTLKILNISFTCGITDAGLRECHSITKLVAAHTNNITTCDPFAKTLVYLNIICNNSMTDDSLRLCTNIKTLFVNEKITTCAPFAASLVELYADSQLRHAKVLLSDKGIATCENIRMLTIVNNDNITSYAPFIKSLRHVYASNDDIKYDKKMYPQIMVEIRKR